MFEKILIANDGSPHARKALTAAIDLAAKCSAELHQISVEEDLPHYAATIGEIQEVKEQRNHFFDTLDRESIAEAEARGVKLTCHVVAGHEVESIINFCKDGGFDLLVIGFMGHSRVFERIWGSTSQTLTRIAPCSVLVVK
jgi:nucleotide-binding universal stress UspA family protein